MVDKPKEEITVDLIRKIAKEEADKVEGTIKFDTDPDNNPVRFENRRRMAWLSLFSILAITGVVLFYIQPEFVNNYTTVLAWVYSVLSAVVLAYFGASTYQYSAFINNKSTTEKNGK